MLNLAGAQNQDSINADLVKNNRYFRYIYDNDFFSQTDRYYTQGIIPELIAPFVKKSPFSKVLIRLNKKVQNYYGLAAEQECFTPKSIRWDTLNRLERPYTGVIFLTHFLVSIDPIKKQRLTTKFDIGAIGPCAKCEEEQKGIHKALKNIAPLGWEWQLSNDLVLNYSGLYEKGMVTKKYFEMIGFADARVGTLYDDIGGGFYFRLGLMNSYFKHYGVIKNAKNKFQFYITAKARGKLVGYNATMQGGPFSTSIYEMDANVIERKVYSLSASAVFAYKRLSLEFSRVYLTKEFERGVEHGWGRCSIMGCF